MKMHEGELDIDETLVRALLTQQFQQWAELPLSRVRSTGTVNAIYRLGEELCVRLPLKPTWSPDLDREQRWLPFLSPRLSLRVPAPVSTGTPTGSYPHSWAIYSWITGQPYADNQIENEPRAALELAQFVLQLRLVELHPEAPAAGRKPLRQLDAVTRTAIDQAQGQIDGAAATAVWGRALTASPWSGSPVWIHSDLLRPNLLVDDGHLRAVIDFGGVGVGDPASDVIAAWSVFGPIGRATFRAALDVDDDTWERARGIALHQAVQIIPYYRDTNPGFVELARRTVEQVIADAEH